MPDEHRCPTCGNSHEAPADIFREPALEDIPSVRELIHAMDVKVAGLEEIKKRLAWTLRRHMVAGVKKRANRPANILILGDSGTGKTYTLRVLLEACKVLVAEVNATEYSDVGFVGRSLPSMYLGLMHHKYHGIMPTDEGGEVHPTPDRIDLMERFGVVLIDEFDKMKGDFNNTPDRQNAKMIAMQAEMLKLAEGADVLVKSTDDDTGWPLRTHGILHIACGAFKGLAAQMTKALDQSGRQVDPPPDIITKVGLYDIVTYGFMEELVGRFATFIPLPQLKPAQVKRILHEQIVPKWESEMGDHGFRVEFDDGALSHITTFCLQNPIGARALDPYIDSTLWGAAVQAEPGDLLLVDTEAAQAQRAKVVKGAVTT